MPFIDCSSIFAIFLPKYTTKSTKREERATILTENIIEELKKKKNKKRVVLTH